MRFQHGNILVGPIVLYRRISFGFESCKFETNTRIFSSRECVCFPRTKIKHFRANDFSYSNISVNYLSPHCDEKKMKEFLGKNLLKMLKCTFNHYQTKKY